MEIDRYLLEPLRSVVEPAGVEVYQANALEADYEAILDGRPAVVVANLPYNVATPLVLHLLESQPLITRMLVMVQKEVGERFAANARDEAYGAASLRVQYFADAKIVGKVGPNVFFPKPNVDSALVSIVRRPSVRVDPEVVSEAALFEVIRTSFAQRRKMLRRSLAGWASEGVFERAGVDSTRRPEELTLEEFAQLAASR
jgi:16S rRNA (adenine1518-N6/adenine1519-N6)-dimethyltransferase